MAKKEQEVEYVIKVKDEYKDVLQNLQNNYAEIASLLNKNAALMEKFVGVAIGCEPISKKE